MGHSTKLPMVRRGFCAGVRASFRNRLQLVPTPLQVFAILESGFEFLVFL